MASRGASDRFLPPSRHVEEPFRLTPQLARRVAALGVLALGVFAILFFRLWALQVLSGDRYLRAAQDNQLRTLRLEAPRGSIVDSNGRLLVSNVPGTAVQIRTADLPKEGRYRLVQRLSTILHVPVARMTAAIEDRKNDPLTPITVKTAVHEDQVAYLYEHRAEFPGVSIVQTYLRHYEHQALAAQILGYVGEISPEELERLPKKGYRGGDRIGKSGVESAFDLELRGRPGAAQLRVDSLGRPQSVLEPRAEPRPGYSVRLTIDVKLQQAAERALRYGIQLARNNGNWAANGGAIVAMSPRDGAILALASNPTYKPSIYVGRVDPKKLEPLVDRDVAKERNFPGLNRAVAGLYPPGSTFKPVTALAAMQEGLLTPYESIQCTPTAVFGQDKHVFRNWNPNVNEPMTLPTALAASCDTYFYVVGNRFYDKGREGRTWLQEWARRFGFDKAAGLDIGGESSGLVPTPEWRKDTYKTSVDRAWNPGDSIQLAIGQKDLLVTPLQMARFYALIANGGKLVNPYLVLDVEQPGDGPSPAVVKRRF
ncbi:MAG: penicillin-binding transpeptidase domain-containing protein, partial [Candidatus Limnocylindria bacterium]|nr:penicillin-binding transpeptidase domain-containing protein [Candidatus Limnocylindria bacterium]